MQPPDKRFSLLQKKKIHIDWIAHTVINLKAEFFYSVILTKYIAYAYNIS